MVAECGELTIEGITIRGTRCGLRDFARRDIAPFAAWQAPEHSWHDTNGPYFGRPTAAEGARVSGAMATLVERPVSALPVPRARLAVVDLTDRLVGVVTWHWESEETGWRRMGIVLFDPAVRGHGIGTEALALWTSYLFETTSVRRLDFATYSGNMAMCGIGRRLGFTEEARFREARAWADQVHDSVVYGVLRVEWASRAIVSPGEPNAVDPALPVEQP